MGIPAACPLNVTGGDAKSLPVKAPPPCLGRSTTPSPAGTVTLPVKAPPPCLGHFTTPSPAETVNASVESTGPLPAQCPPAHPASSVPSISAQATDAMMERAKHLPVKAPSCRLGPSSTSSPEDRVNLTYRPQHLVLKCPPPHPASAATECARPLPVK